MKVNNLSRFQKFKLSNCWVQGTETSFFNISLIGLQAGLMLTLEKQRWLILWASRLKLEILIREEFCVTSCLFVKVSPIASFVAVRKFEKISAKLAT